MGCSTCGDTAALWQSKHCARDNTVHPTLKGKLHVWWFWFRATKATGNARQPIRQSAHVNKGKTLDVSKVCDPVVQPKTSLHCSRGGQKKAPTQQLLTGTQRLPFATGHDSTAGRALPNKQLQNHHPSLAIGRGESTFFWCSSHCADTRSPMPSVPRLKTLRRTHYHKRETRGGGGGLVLCGDQNRDKQGQSPQRRRKQVPSSVQ